MYNRGGSNMQNRRTQRSELFGNSQQPQFASGFSNLHNEQAQAMMEAENNSALDSLHGKLSVLRGLAGDINQEVESQNAYLDGMNDEMGSTNNLLSQTMTQLNAMVTKDGGSHMCYLILFCMFIFFSLWWFI
eukprot:g2597.t1